MAKANERDRLPGTSSDSGMNFRGVIRHTHTSWTAVGVDTEAEKEAKSPVADAKSVAELAKKARTDYRKALSEIEDKISIGKHLQEVVDKQIQALRSEAGKRGFDLGGDTEERERKPVSDSILKKRKLSQLETL